MQVGYCRLVTISTNNVIEINELRTAVGAGWTFLSDSRRILQKALDIAEYTGGRYNSTGMIGGRRRMAMR